MKLLNRVLHCGGPNGCGMVIEFQSGETVEDAVIFFRDHRADPQHPAWVEAAKKTEADVKALMKTGKSKDEIEEETLLKPGVFRW